MPTVFELSEPYLNHLVPILPAGTGVCAVCWRAIEPRYRLCYEDYLKVLSLIAAPALYAIVIK